MALTILVADDEPVLLETMSHNLRQVGYNVLTAQDGIRVLEVTQRDIPDLVILDLMLPEYDGIEVCRRLRQQSVTATLPILMLTGRAEEIDKVIGLEVGADDYLTKPFGRHELLARIHALLLRSSYPTQPDASLLSAEGGGQRFSGAHEVVAGPVRIDEGGRRVICRGQILDLQPKQFDLLLCLARNRGVVLTRSVLLNRVWGYDYAGDTRTVDVHIRWLREKVEEDPANPCLIQTVRGVGYVFR
jgi:DNA-binding response OmpR family regulator